MPLFQVAAGDKFLSCESCQSTKESMVNCMLVSICRALWVGVMSSSKEATANANDVFGPRSLIVSAAAETTRRVNINRYSVGWTGQSASERQRCPLYESVRSRGLTFKRHRVEDRSAPQLLALRLVSAVRWFAAGFVAHRSLIAFETGGLRASWPTVCVSGCSAMRLIAPSRYYRTLTV